MGKSISEIQKDIFSRINDPQSRIHLKVAKKEIVRSRYLEEIKQEVLREGGTEYQANDTALMVDKALWGFGILDALVNEAQDVSDIRLVDENHVRLKRLGKREDADIRFASKEEYLHYIEFITNRNNTNMSVVNAAQVFTDKDSSPTNILRFTLASQMLNSNDRPTLLIRKIPKDKITFQKLLEDGYLTKEQYDYLADRWKNGHGFLVCGPNGSGKTTFINAMLEETPHELSAIIIQESEELFCDSHPETVLRKVIPRRSGSEISYSLKDLARIALMESFDIMVVGEIKGGEAADLAYATYTGSQCMTSVHSNSAAEGYDKIIDYALEERPERRYGDFAKQLQALDTAVYIENYKVKEIVEMDRYDEKRKRFFFNVPEVSPTFVAPVEKTAEPVAMDEDTNEEVGEE